MDYCPTGQHEDGCCHHCDHGYPVVCVCLEPERPRLTLEELKERFHAPEERKP